MPIAMYPGSFDPVTRGHLDIIKRSSRMFDTLIVAVLNNSAKTPLFTVKEREEMLRECCKDIPNVKVMSFDGLTVNFAQQQHATRSSWRTPITRSTRGSKPCFCQRP